VSVCVVLPWLRRFSRPPVTTGIRVQFQVIRYGIVGVQNGSE